jgi:hypothetical protein
MIFENFNKGDGKTGNTCFIKKMWVMLSPEGEGVLTPSPSGSGEGATCDTSL